MNKPDHTLQIAARVIRSAHRDNPADAALRGELKKQRGLSAVESSWIADAVFSYYRWLGWLDQRQSLKEQILSARSLAKAFEQYPAQFSNQDMLAKALPNWAVTEIPVSPEWVRALQSKPRLWLRARAALGSDLAMRLGNCVASGVDQLPDAIEYRGGADLFRSTDFHAGEFEVQDLSSQVAGWLCDPKPGETWWDACAGEGGKMLHLSDLMRNKGLIWASDRAEWRLMRLRIRAARAKAFNYRTAIWEGGPKLPTRTRFDGVLLDAPCSGVGTWQRNPHARWTTTPNDVVELAAVQLSLLRHAANAVKPGGKLVYSVCTLTRAETTENATAFGAWHKEFTPLPLNNPLNPGGPPVDRVWLWPQDFGGNGMFVAAWRRVVQK